MAYRKSAFAWFKAEGDVSWFAEANCRGADPNIFVPPETEGSGSGGVHAAEERARLTELAKSYCRDCPVRLECLDFALRNGIKDGVWGGLSERQLKNERRKRHRVRLAEERLRGLTVRHDLGDLLDPVAR